MRELELRRLSSLCPVTGLHTRASFFRLGQQELQEARRRGRPLALLMVAYAFSPIDLIPDFIPILGYLDEAILLPIGIWFTLKLVPAPVIEASRAQAEQWLTEKNAKPRSWLGAAIMIAIWIAFLWWAWRWYQSGTPF